MTGDKQGYSVPDFFVYVLLLNENLFGFSVLDFGKQYMIFLYIISLQNSMEKVVTPLWTKFKHFFEIEINLKHKPTAWGKWI